MTIASITNGEAGSSVRTSLNAAIDLANSVRITLTASGAIAAGRAVGVNSSGNAVQGYAGSATVGTRAAFFAGASPSVPPSPFVVVLGPSNIVLFDANGETLGVQACSISGNTLTPGTPDTSGPSVNIGSNIPNCVAALTTSTFVMAIDDSITSFADLIIGSVSGNAVSYGTAVIVDIANAFIGAGLTVLKLSATAFACVYQLGDNSLNIVVGTVSGTTITLGTPVQVLASVDDLIGAAMLSATAISFAYTVSGISYLAAATISGTTPSPGAPQALASVPTTLISLSSTEVAYAAVASTSHIGAASVSGNAVTLGTPITVAANIGFLSKMSSTLFASGSGALGGSPLIFTVAGGSALSYTQSTTYNTLTGVSVGSALSSSLIAFFDTASNLYSEDNIGSLSAGAALGAGSPSLRAIYALDGTHALATYIDGGEMYGSVVVPSLPWSDSIGFTAAGASDAAPVIVQTAGKVAGFTSLTPSAYYYTANDGSLTLTNTGRPGGLAVSATEIVIK